MVMRDVPRMVVTIFIIALGVWFIRGPKKAKVEEIPAFTPPAEPVEDDTGGAEAAESEQEDGHGDE